MYDAGAEELMHALAPRNSHDYTCGFCNVGRHDHCPVVIACGAHAGREVRCACAAHGHSHQTSTRRVA